MPLYHAPELEAARCSLRVRKTFAQLWGTADLWLTIDQTSFNAPQREGVGSRGFPLHWDTSLAPPIPFGTQAILYLTDTAADQGALRLVPGFHRRIESWLAALGDADPREIDLNAEAITVPAQAGDLIIWHHALPYNASPNLATKPRLALYLNMYAAQEDLRDWR